MKFLKYFWIVIISFFLNIGITNAKDNIAFIDIDLILKNSNLGKSLLRQFEEINKENANKLKIKENELKMLEDEIKKKQNLISREELEKEINILKDKINNFNQTKNNLVLDFEKKRNKDINELLLKINPIIQNYMNENSIDILLERKNVFIGKNDSDITDIIIKTINENLN